MPPGGQWCWARRASSSSWQRPQTSCTREGSRVELTAIGAASVNQAIKAIAIARQYVEEEAIDLCFRPEFVEIAEGSVGNLGEGAHHGQGGPTSALRIIVLVEQT